MSSSKFSEEFKRDAVAQISERGYPVREVSKPLGVSPYSLYARSSRISSGPSRTSAKMGIAAAQPSRSGRLHLRAKMHGS
jgi:transposase